MARIASRHLLRTFVPLAVLSAATVGTVHAQVPFLTDLFKRAQTLNVNWEFYQPTSQPIGVNPGRMRGLLFEASFLLGRFPPPAGKSPSVAGDSLAEIDSTLEVRRDSQRVSRTARWIVREKTSPDTASNQFALELALGYGQMTGFSSSDTTYRVYGSLEEFPVVSLYLGFPRRRERPSIEPYLGVRIGFVRLSGFQAFVGSSTADISMVYTASSSTYLVAGMAGLEISFVPRVDFFIEAGITQRRFDGIQYSATGSSIVPNKLPQTIQLRTYGLTLGAQLSLQP